MAPSRIKCTSCSKVKTETAFSNKQLLQLQRIMTKNPAANPAATAYIVCRECNTTQLVELTCTDCKNTMALKSFSGNERSKGKDEATCKKCVDKRGEDDDDGSEDDEDESGSGDDEGEGGTTVGGTE